MYLMTLNLELIWHVINNIKLQITFKNFRQIIIIQRFYKDFNFEAHKNALNHLKILDKIYFK